MTRFLNSLRFALIVLMSMSGFQITAHASDRFPKDKSRNVLSFADKLEPVLPSVVRVGRLEQNAEGNSRLAGIGSGAVIDAKNGYIITNAHVVDGGHRFAVNVLDGRVIEARLIGIDTPTDIALLQADDLRVDDLEIADSDKLRVGDVVFAVGYPLGLEQSLSFGVISGLGRSSSNTGLQDFIQTDAAINSGNSGGPLLNSKGQLVGINTAIVTRSGGSNGIGFSVPTSLAIQVADHLISHGEVRRGSVGIEMARVSEAASEKVGINHWDGALVSKVLANSPAQKAGLLPGDVIIGFNGKTVKTPHALLAWIGVASIDDTHRITYIRKNGRKRRTDITVRSIKNPLVSSLEQLGAFLRPITSADNVPAGITGVYVSKITKDSSAERAGLLVGDILISVNDEVSTTRQKSDQLLNRSKGRARLLVYRFGNTIPIIIEP